MYKTFVNKDSPEYGKKEYYDEWYGRGKAVRAVFGIPAASQSSLNKAIAPWDPPTSPYTYYFDAAFSAEVEALVMRDSSMFKLLRKETFQRLGDSYKYFETDVDGVTGVDGSSTPFASGSVESGPTFATLEQFKPAYIVDPWETDFTSGIESEWQPFPNNNEAWLKEYHKNKFPNALDVMLTQDVDVVANDGSTYLNVESIDRIISTYTESGAGTTWVSAATDGDIYWGKSTALIDRSADTDDTFGAGAGSGVSLPSSADARTLDLGDVDDVLAAALDYAETENYIMVTGRRTLNEINKIVANERQVFGEEPMYVSFTSNGVSTDSGIKGRMATASIISNGIQIPIFTNKHVVGENGRNETTKVTDCDIGNIYLINLDDVHLRMAVPSTYIKTPPAARLTGDKMKDRHMIMMGTQLIATNFRSHAAVKYLKKT